MWIGIIKTENKGIGIRLGIKKKELDQELELKKWNWTQVWRIVQYLMELILQKCTP